MSKKTAEPVKECCETCAHSTPQPREWWCGKMVICNKGTMKQIKYACQRCPAYIAKQQEEIAR